MISCKLEEIGILESSRCECTPGARKAPIIWATYSTTVSRTSKQSPFGNKASKTLPHYSVWLANLHRFFKGPTKEAGAQAEVRPSFWANPAAPGVFERDQLWNRLGASPKKTSATNWQSISISSACATINQ